LQPIRCAPQEKASLADVLGGGVFVLDESLSFKKNDNELVVLSQQKHTETRSSRIFKARLVEWKYHFHKLDDGRFVVKDSGLIPIKELISIASWKR